MLKIPAKIFGAILICLIVMGNARIEADDSDAQNIAKIKWLYPPKYFYGNDFSEGRAWVQEEKGGTWMLLDDNGNTLKEGIEAKHIWPYRNGLALFESIRAESTGTSRGFFDISGDIVLTPMHLKAYGFFYNEGFILERSQDGSFGFLNMRGDWVIQPTYESASYFSEKMAPVKKNGKWGYIDTSGNIQIDFLFDSASSFSDGIAAVSEKALYGLIDSKGNWLVKPIYEVIYSPYSDFIGVQKNGKVGFIDKTGKVVIDFQFLPIEPQREFAKDIYCFHNERASVILDRPKENIREYGIIDKSGDVVFRLTGGGFPYFNGDYLPQVGQTGQFDVYDINGLCQILPASFKYPPISLSSTVSNIFTFHDEERNQTGYFMIEQE